MTAKEMFKNLGYKQDKKSNYIIYYHNLKFNREYQVEFNFNYKTIEVRKLGFKIESHTINLKLNKAIQKQIAELGWED